jgi:uncharacterized protein Yka (UPF0111/DUF47 family)
MPRRSIFTFHSNTMGDKNSLDSWSSHKNPDNQGHVNEIKKKKKETDRITRDTQRIAREVREMVEKKFGPQN